MSAEDYMPDDLGMEFYWHRPWRTSRMPTCYRCGRRNLTWGVSGGHWRLFENASVHQCDARNDFTATKEQP